MTQSSPILSLPYLQPSQSQKHVTHNEALQVLDLAVQLAVKSLADTTPPPSPTEGDVYVPASGATDAWAGHDQEIAVFRDGEWFFAAPNSGWRAWDEASQRLWVWTGSNWAPPITATDNLVGLGVGTAADSTNVLAARGPATLLTGSGAGHQLKINKSATTDTASMLFQSNWSGHAEMGLIGGLDFSFKVSPDGTQWTNALTFDAATGRAGFGVDTPSARLHAQGATAEPVLRAHAPDNAYAATAVEVIADSVGTAAFEFARFTSSGQVDAEFIFSGDGNATCDGGWTGGGADYAEYFEWVDGNPDREDRRGISVVLAGDRIRPAEPGEDPIGVISATPSVVGDGDIGRWKGKYLRDAFGAVLTEDCEVFTWEDDEGRHSYAAGSVPEGVCIPEEAIRTVQPRRVRNPDFVETAPYTSRADRPEWAVVGLMGKLRVRSGQPTGDRWIRMRRTGENVEEWLVR